MLSCIIAVIAAMAACKRNGDAADTVSAAATSTNGDSPISAMPRVSENQDPCTFLSAAEATKYIGALATPPYRSDDAHPNEGGDVCVYRSRDGRELQIKGGSGGGADVGSVLENIPKKLGAAMSAGGAPGMDTMANRVMAKGPPGPWDKATWIPGGSLFVTKGDQVLVVDVNGASGKESDAAEIATIATPRIGHPIDYDGAKAVALVPKPPAHSANPCEFISPSDVEAAIGKLAGAPVADSSGSTCTYRVETSHGTREYPVSYTWEGGAHAMNMVKHAQSMLGGLMGMPSSSPLDTMKPNGQMGEMIGGMMKAVTGGSMTTAPGAAATTGFRTDTTLAGPWDQAMLWHGTQLMAVRHDAMVGISLKSADYEHAKALLAAIATKL
jgi:hypothetical protein